MRKTRLLSLLVLLMTAATGAWAVIHSSYTVKMKDGTDDITNWSLTPAGVTTVGVESGSQVTLTYSGERELKV